MNTNKLLANWFCKRLKSPNTSCFFSSVAKLATRPQLRTNRLLDNLSIAQLQKIRREFLLKIPSHIQIPDQNFKLIDDEDEPIVKTPVEIEGIRKSSQLAAKTLNYLCEATKEGMTTDELDRLAFEYIIKHDAYPSPLNYKGFPRSICTSVNECVCHGIPNSSVILKKGDIINIDVTVFKDGFHGDTSRTIAIGEIDESTAKLIATTEQCLHAGISVCKPGENYLKIADAITDIAEASGFSIALQFTGHGIGRGFHEAPRVYHVRDSVSKLNEYFAHMHDEVGDADDEVQLLVDKEHRMKEGHVFTIEPILLSGKAGLVMFDDEWTIVTKDRNYTAQSEHTVAITSNGVEILTVAT